MNKLIAYWRAVLGGIGVACIAGTIFAQSALSVILGAIIGVLSLLAGMLITTFEE